LFKLSVDQTTAYIDMVFTKLGSLKPLVFDAYREEKRDRLSKLRKLTEVRKILWFSEQIRAGRLIFAI